MKKITKNILGIMLVMLLAFAFAGCNLVPEDGTNGTNGTNGVDGTNGTNGTNGNDLTKPIPPVISTNEVDLQIKTIGYNKRGVDNFPSITMLVRAAKLDGTFIPGLLAPDFFDFVDENGKGMGPMVVQELDTGGTDKVDIVFVMDTTGSMYGEIATLKTDISNFTATLDASDLDWRVGMTTFGDDFEDETTYGDRVSIAPTDDLATFQTFVDGLSASGGEDGPENQIDAIDWARATPGEGTNPAGSYQDYKDFTYRSGAKIIFILITDIESHTPEDPGDVANYYAAGGPYSSPVYNTLTDEITRLNARNISVDVAGPDIPEYHTLADSTNGLWFDLGGDFSVILDSLSTAVTSNYLITYLTTNHTANAERTVRIAVHTAFGNAQATATYTSPSVVPYAALSRGLVVEPVSGNMLTGRSNY